MCIWDKSVAATSNNSILSPSSHLYSPSSGVSANSGTIGNWSTIGRSTQFNYSLVTIGEEESFSLSENEADMWQSFKLDVGNSVFVSPQT